MGCNRVLSHHQQIHSSHIRQTAAVQAVQVASGVGDHQDQQGWQQEGGQQQQEKATVIPLQHIHNMPAKKKNAAGWLARKENFTVKHALSRLVRTLHSESPASCVRAV